MLFFLLKLCSRILPVLAVVVLVSGTLLRYFGSGPYWYYLTEYFQKPCESHWWSAILFVQNYVNVDSMVCFFKMFRTEVLYVIPPVCWAFVVFGCGHATVLFVAASFASTKKIQKSNDRLHCFVDFNVHRWQFRFIMEQPFGCHV